jgi:hypothetical protein
MSNKKTMLVSSLEQANVINPTGLEDLGFKHGGALKTVKELATWALDNVVGFPNEVSADDIAKVRKGYLHRYSLDNPSKSYVVIENALCLESDLVMSGIEIPKNAERRNIGVDYAFSFTSQEAGKLKESESEPKNLYTIVKEIRNDANKYTSNSWGKLTAEGVKVDSARKGEKKERKANLDFYEFLYDKDKGVIALMQTRCKNAKVKGDSTADEKRLQKAIVAFNVAYKHKE